jgi:hypothetical protein
VILDNGQGHFDGTLGFTHQPDSAHCAAMHERVIDNRLPVLTSHTAQLQQVASCTDLHHPVVPSRPIGHRGQYDVQSHRIQLHQNQPSDIN